jgi:hypothetical protein
MTNPGTYLANLFLFRNIYYMCCLLFFWYIFVSDFVCFFCRRFGKKHIHLLRKKWSQVFAGHSWETVMCITSSKKFGKTGFAADFHKHVYVVIKSRQNRNVQLCPKLRIRNNGVLKAQ